MFLKGRLLQTSKKLSGFLALGPKLPPINVDCDENDLVMPVDGRKCCSGSCHRDELKLERTQCWIRQYEEKKMYRRVRNTPRASTSNAMPAADPFARISAH
jgi:hypothetical protein